MEPHRVVVFDLGKVLVDYDYDIAARAIAARSRVSRQAVRELIDQSPLLCLFEIGSIDAEEFFHRVQKEAGYNGSLEEFVPQFSAIFSPIEEMVQVQQRLVSRKISTAILSNTNSLAQQYIRNTFPFFSTFDHYVFSYEVGVMKPAAKIYQVLEEKTGATGHEILYLDDREENVAAALERGWDSIHHLEVASTLRQLKDRHL